MTIDDDAGAHSEVGDGEDRESNIAADLALLESTLEATEDGILVVDNSGTIVRYNTKFCQLWSIPNSVLATGQDRLAIESVLDLLVDPNDFVRGVNELYADPACKSYDLLHLRDGRVFERYSSPHVVSGKIKGRVWCFRDLTDRYRMADQLRHAQKLEAVANLAGGVAHDFNNLLTVVKGHAEFLLRDLPPRAEYIEPVEEILAAAGRAASLTRQLLAFSRKQVMQAEITDLNTVVRAVKPLLSRLVGADILVEVQLGELHSVVADPSQLQQVLMNLVLNACDAMPNGGTLTIATRNVTLDAESDIVKRGVAAVGAYVVLNVRDTGAGIPVEIQTRVFEPFFSTKGAGSSSGLGLATAHGIITQSGGHICFDSEVGKGTTFTVALVASGEPMVRHQVPLTTSDSAAATETILLVEDEDGVRNLARRILERRGYSVFTAANGADALRAAADLGDRVDLVLTDVVMPGMNGAELYDRLAEVLPSTPVMFMSGYTGEDVARRGGVPSGTTFLQKPFAGSDLLAAVRDALGKSKL